MKTKVLLATLICAFGVTGMFFESTLMLFAQILTPLIAIMILLYLGYGIEGFFVIALAVICNIVLEYFFSRHDVSLCYFASAINAFAGGFLAVFLYFGTRIELLDRKSLDFIES